MAALGIAAGAAAALYLAALLATSRLVTPNAKYTVLRTVRPPSGEPFELRRYDAHFVAETDVAAPDLRAAGSAGFRPLARYIFGGTADGSKIAMTTPVALADHGGGAHAVRFFLPPSAGAPPAPADARVRVRAVPASLLAVRALPVALESLDSARFSRAADALAADAARAGLAPDRAGAVQFSYDPPWTPFVLRRNEVALEVREEREGGE
jgi:hypothetical protein